MQFYSRLRVVGVGSALPFPALLLLFWNRKSNIPIEFYWQKVNRFIKKWSMIQSVATLGKELPGEWKKCCLGARATWSFWLWQRSNMLCRQRARRVDAAVSTAFPTRGVHTQSKLYCLRQLFQHICIYSCNFSWINYVHRGSRFSTRLNNQTVRKEVCAVNMG